MRYFRAFTIVAILLAGTLLVRAKESGGGSSPSNRDESVLCMSRTDDGLFRAALSISPRHVRLSDTLTLTLRIHYDQTVRPIVPEFGETLGDFDVLSTEQRLTTEQRPSVENGDTLTVREVILTLVPQRAGTIDIWPIPLQYAVSQTGTHEEMRTMTLPACRIDVSTPFASEQVSLDRIVSQPQPLSLTSKSWGPLLVAAGLVVVLAIGLFLLVLRRRRGPIDPLPALDLEDVALERLRQLVESHLHESDVRRFYIELTAIVRWYVEQITNIRAPERTTEEFLREIGSAGSKYPQFDSETQERLRHFLNDADLVKFAKVRPGPEEIMNGYHSACRFVSRKKEDDSFSP